MTRRRYAAVDTAPLRVRCKQAVTQCMHEVGHEAPRWLHADPGEPDTYLLPLFPKGMTRNDPGAESYRNAIFKAITLTSDRIGWPSWTGYPE